VRRSASKSTSPSSTACAGPVWTNTWSFTTRTRSPLAMPRSAASCGFTNSSAGTPRCAVQGLRTSSKPLCQTSFTRPLVTRSSPGRGRIAAQKLRHGP
jgi:hypothetical protein